MSDYENEPDVERRLMFEIIPSTTKMQNTNFILISYISNLDPLYILALTETARHTEIHPLRDALRNHVPRQSSLKIKIMV